MFALMFSGLQAEPPPVFLSTQAPSETFVNEQACIVIPESQKLVEISLDPESLRANLYAVLGYYGGEIDKTQADVAADSGTLSLGSAANHFQGYAIWKVRFEDSNHRPGRIFADGVFTGTPASQASGFYVAAVPDIQIAGSTDLTPPAPEFQVRVDDTPESFDHYPATLELRIPEGVSEFFIILADAGGNGVWRLQSLRIELD